MPSAWRGPLPALPRMREYVPDLEEPERADLQSWKRAVAERDAPVVKRGFRNRKGGY